MAAPFDFTKVRRDRTKRLGLRIGFDDPVTWINTGNFALNKMISGHFDRGIPLGAVTVFAGEPSSGKSYIVSGNIVKNALAQDCQVIILDSEDALKRDWMQKLGVDTQHPNLSREPVATIDHVADCINEYATAYISHHKDIPREQQPKVLFVVDSLGFLQTQVEIDQFNAGDLKGDKGIKAKMLKMLVANCIRLFSGYEIGLVATNHTYKSQDRFSPDDVISGGSGFMFAASIVVRINKFKLKADSDGKKTSEVLGIRSKIKCEKTRFAKPFEEVEVAIPYETGMNPYSGLFDLCEQKKVVTPVPGGRYHYRGADGIEHKLYRKEMTPEFFDMVMREWHDQPAQVSEEVYDENDE